jgi:hypothetical protein
MQVSHRRSLHWAAKYAMWPRRAALLFAADTFESDLSQPMLKMISFYRCVLTQPCG